MRELMPANPDNSSLTIKLKEVFHLPAAANATLQ
jgi:L-rhamnose mutarotase